MSHTPRLLLTEGGGRLGRKGSPEEGRKRRRQDGRREDESERRDDVEISNNSHMAGQDGKR